MEPGAEEDRRRRFHLQALIGAGAFGEVYLAEQDSGAGFRKRVALKLLHAELQGMKEAGKRMRDEARILGRLSHRSIVTVLDLVKLGERWAVVMDYVPGADLEQAVKALQEDSLHFPIPAALECGAEVLDALHAAFNTDDGQGGKLSVIHRDIKPSNIRLTQDGEVKVLDFGVASVNLDTREAQTRAGGWMGTERYMAPERILCEGDEPAGDVYATVASVVELINREPLGRTPVLEERHAPFVRKATDKVRDRMKSAEAGLADELVDWLERGLAADPDHRPTAQELSDAFLKLARRLPGQQLRPFAREFVPRVEEILGAELTPAQGVLTEYSGSKALGSSASVSEVPSNPTLQGEPSNQTFMYEAAATVAEEPAASGSRRRALVPIALLSGFLTALVVLVLGVSGVAVVLNRPSAQDPTPTTQPKPPAPAPVLTPVPSPVPVVVPKPTPVAPEPTVAVEPAPAPTPRPTTAPRPAPAPVPVSQPPLPAPDAPEVNRALVVFQDATSITVHCGEASASGSSTARIRNFPAGPCTVNAMYLGKSYTTQVNIERPREVACSAAGGALTCQ